MRPLLLADAAAIAVVIFARVSWAIVTETCRQNCRCGETLLVTYMVENNLWCPDVGADFVSVVVMHLLM